MKRSAPDNAERLSKYLHAIDAENIHLVCHSLGGLVARHCLARHQGLNIGRVVMLGTPNQASIAAEKLRHWPGGRLILGQSLDDGLLGPVPPWDSGYPLGVIAGDLRFGLGTFIPGIPGPNDGTVTVDETRLPGMHDHIVIHCTHFGLLLSHEAFKQTQRFIEHGQFDHD